MGLTTYQAELGTVVAAKVSGSLSMMGSSFIIRNVYKKWRKIRTRANEHLPTTTCLVLNMSIADLLCSFFAHFLGSWLVPKEGGFPMAAGNQATCTFQAFAWGLFYAAGGLVSGLLALAYWLTICREKPEAELRSWKWMALLYGCPWGYGLVYAAATRYIIDPSEYPFFWYCGAVFVSPSSPAFSIFMIIGCTYMGVITLLVFYSMLSLIRTVYLAERRMDRFSPTRNLHVQAEEHGRNRGHSRSREKTIQVTKQGVLYIAAWLLIMIPMIIQAILFFLFSERENPVGNVLPSWYLIFSACIIPSQGLFNAIIYFRPKVEAVHRRDGLSMRQSVARVLGLKVPTFLTALTDTMRSSSSSIRRSMRRRSTIFRGGHATDLTIGTFFSGIPNARLETELTNDGRAADSADEGRERRGNRLSILRFAGISMPSDIESGGSGDPHAGNPVVKRENPSDESQEKQGQEKPQSAKRQSVRFAGNIINAQDSDVNHEELPNPGATKRQSVKRKSLLRFAGISSPSEDVESEIDPDAGDAANVDHPERQAKRESVKRQSLVNFAGISFSFSSSEINSGVENPDAGSPE